MTTSEVTAGPSLAGKYLTFVLGHESYGIPVLKVREIIRLTAVTPVPQMPQYIKGVINLRGKIIPVLDLCMLFGIQCDGADESACIVVVQVTSSNGQTIPLGLGVQAVDEVCHLAASDIEETPDFGVSVNTACILGMAKSKDGVKTLLDIDRVLAGNALEAVTSGL